jgi:hypothetical protein
VTEYVLAVVLSALCLLLPIPSLEMNVLELLHASFKIYLDSFSFLLALPAP